MHTTPAAAAAMCDTTYIHILMCADVHTLTHTQTHTCPIHPKSESPEVHHPEPALHGTCGRVGHAQTNTHIYSRAEDVVTAATTINVPLNTAACISGVGATAHTNICTQQLVHIYTL
jgi:hypothetical protein